MCILFLAFKIFSQIQNLEKKGIWSLNTMKTLLEGVLSRLLSTNRTREIAHVRVAKA